RLDAAHPSEQLEDEARALEVGMQRDLLEPLRRLLAHLERAERMERRLRERAVVALGRLHERVDDLGVRLVALQCEAEGDDRLLTNRGMRLRIVRVGEQRRCRLLVLEVSEDLDRRGDRAGRSALLLLRREEVLDLRHVRAALVAVGGLDLLAYRERGGLRSLRILAREALDERAEGILASELREGCVERAPLLRRCVRH